MVNIEPTCIDSAEGKIGWKMRKDVEARRNAPKIAISEVFEWSQRSDQDSI
jgi:hypothetical protein